MLTANCARCNRTIASEDGRTWEGAAGPLCRRGIHDDHQGGHVPELDTSTRYIVPCYVLGCRQDADRSSHHRRFGRVRSCHDHDPNRHGVALPFVRRMAQAPEPEPERPAAGPMAPVRPMAPKTPPGPTPDANPWPTLDQVAPRHAPQVDAFTF
jgi:hypothetical protein